MVAAPSYSKIDGHLVTSIIEQLKEVFMLPSYMKQR